MHFLLPPLKWQFPLQQTNTSLRQTSVYEKLKGNVFCTISCTKHGREILSSGHVFLPLTHATYVTQCNSCNLLQHTLNVNVSSFYGVLRINPSLTEAEKPLKLWDKQVCHCRFSQIFNQLLENKVNQGSELLLKEKSDTQYRNKSISKSWWEYLLTILYE